MEHAFSQCREWWLRRRARNWFGIPHTESLGLLFFPAWCSVCAGIIWVLILNRTFSALVSKTQPAHPSAIMPHYATIAMLWGGAVAPPIPFVGRGWTPPDSSCWGGVGPLPTLSCMHVCNPTCMYEDLANAYRHLAQGLSLPSPP